MSDNRPNSPKAKTASNKASTTPNPTPAAADQPISNGLNNVLFLIAGLVLGLVVGFFVTNSLNSGTPNVAAGGKAGPLKGNEKLPDGHPGVDENKIDIEAEVKAAVQYGKDNPDYDAQLKVANFLYSQARKYNEARPYFVKAHEMKPNEFEPIVQLGNLAFDTSQETNNPKLMIEAAEWYEKALKIRPEDVSVRTDLGLTYQLREPPDYQTALGHFEKTLAVEPKHTPTLYNKARALLSLKKLKEAEETFVAFKATNPQPEMLKRLQEEFDRSKGVTAASSDTQQKIPSH
jgi:hypothetical protein